MNLPTQAHMILRKPRSQATAMLSTTRVSPVNNAQRSKPWSTAVYGTAAAALLALPAAHTACMHEPP